MSFRKLGLDISLIKALTDYGYETPTPVQQKTIGPVLDGHDVMATAQTGTGKTAAFTLPLLQRLSARQLKRKPVRGLVVTPTRELAAQVLVSINRYGKHLPLTAMSVYGGVKIGPQIRQLKQGVDIVVATPGRLLDLHQQKAIDLTAVEVLVLDEADRMLDMGFIHDIRKIRARLPEALQTLMFSATFSGDIRKLGESMMVEPLQIDTAPRNATAAAVEQLVIPIDKQRKAEAITHLYDLNNSVQSLVFTRTKHGANKLVKVLNRSGIKAEAIHGNKSQNHRLRVLDQFKKGSLDVLVATDIASRGLDIKELPLVINYELPDVPEDYVHRIGRTGRAGKDGYALSLVCADEARQLHAIEKLTSTTIPRDELEGFEPEVVVPMPRKPKSGNRVPEKSGRKSNTSRRRRSRGRRAKQAA